MAQAHVKNIFPSEKYGALFTVIQDPAYQMINISHEDMTSINTILSIKADFKVQTCGFDWISSLPVFQKSTESRTECF